MHGWLYNELLPKINEIYSITVVHNISIFTTLKSFQSLNVSKDVLCYFQTILKFKLIPRLQFGTESQNKSPKKKKIVSRNITTKKNDYFFPRRPHIFQSVNSKSFTFCIYCITANEKPLDKVSKFSFSPQKKNTFKIRIESLSLTIKKKN